MRNYIYPQNLKASANIWFWSLKDFLILGVCALVSVALIVELKSMLPAALTLCYAFLSIRLDEITILDFIKYAVRYFITTQQIFEWR